MKPDQVASRSQVESLKERLEHTQQELAKSHDSNRDLKTKLQTVVREKDPSQVRFLLVLCLQLCIFGRFVKAFYGMVASYYCFICYIIYSIYLYYIFYDCYLYHSSAS